MGRHREKDREKDNRGTSSLGKILKDIDMGQIMNIMSALGSRNPNSNNSNNNNNNNNATNNKNIDTDKKTEDIMQLLSNEQFMKTVSELSNKIKESKDDGSKEKAIKDAIGTIQSIMKENKNT